MKIGIVTLFGDNYGNKLQNYALQTLLENLGHDVKTILIKDGMRIHQAENIGSIFLKANPSYIKKVVSSRFKNKYPYKNQRDGILSSIKFSKTNKPSELIILRKASFSEYTNQKIHVEQQVFTPGNNKYPDLFDAYICGSDQVWNPTYASISPAYFLQFVPENKRIAFAPSFGLSRIPDNIKPLYKKWLNGIPYLSVREDKGASIIKELTGRDVPVLPDPTLCLTREAWEELEKKPEHSDEPYILTYFLGNETNRYRRFIEKYSHVNSCKIINLFDMREPEHYAVNPAEFIWLVHHAEALFTDSFHGTVFSLIFHIPFVVFERIESGGNGMSSRIETLLGLVGLDERIFGKVKLEDVPIISFSYSDMVIMRKSTEAKRFLENALCKSRACGKPRETIQEK